jgi:HEAT repeat protein
VEELLQKLMESFDDSPAISSKRMRELLESDRAAFRPAALASLRQAQDNRAYRYLVALLAGNHMLVKIVCDPSLRMPAALMLARTGIKANPALDADLARELVNQMGTDTLGDDVVIRSLGILGAISSGRRLLPLLTTLLHHPNPRVRSKVALLIGRRQGSVRWVEHHKDEGDPRVRANAIEGLWGSTDEGVQKLLWEASRDQNNRVAGNALIGLYRMGDVRGIGAVLDMAAHAEARFRATAGWVMGESADPRFLAPLGRMLADPDKMVRARAFRALGAVRQRAAKLTARERLRSHLWEARLLADGTRRLRLAVTDAAGAFLPLSPTQFVVTEDSEAITEYEVCRRAAPPSLAIGWGWPRSQENAAVPIEKILRECLRQKRPQPLWALLPYSADPSAGSPAESSPEPRFASSPAILAPLLERQATRLEAANGPVHAAQLLLAGVASLGGERHLVLIGGSPQAGVPAKDTERIGAKARYHGIAIHGLALSASVPWLESLCAATGGRLLRADTAEQIRAALWRIFWGVQSQGEITYRLEKTPATPASVRVQIWSDLGTADDCLQLE